MRTRIIQTLCDRGDGNEATRVYVRLPDGRYHVDLCDKHIAELKKWFPAQGPALKKDRVVSVDQVERKRRAAKKAVANGN